MYYIDDYRKRAIDKIIPYLIEFPQVVKIIEGSADRYQAIEDIIWNIANNFRVEDSRGVFLTAHANNEVTNIIYTDKADDAFTYGSEEDVLNGLVVPIRPDGTGQAYGTGHYYSQASYISGIRKNISEEKMIRAVQAQIIKNNTDCTIEDVIEGLKLIYNAEHVHIYESNPLCVSVLLIGDSLELSSSGNYENIKSLLPACVSLKDIYVDYKTFNTFKYNEQSSYGDTRYPIRVGETLDVYPQISPSILLSSEDEEYIKTNKVGLKENDFICICGMIDKLNDNGTIFSFPKVNETDEMICIKSVQEDGVTNIVVTSNNVEYILAEDVYVDDRFTIVCSYSNGNLNLYYNNKVILTGILDNDNNTLYRMLNSEPTLQIGILDNINSNLYINSLGNENYGDYIYFAIVLGKKIDSSISLSEYYVTCFGEKQVLFNCLENKNHLNINTNNELTKDIIINQSYYNYKETHSNGKYAWFDGKSGIDYIINEQDIDCNVDNLEISFDICMPTEINAGVIVSDFVGKEEFNSEIGINEDGCLNLKVEVLSRQTTDGLIEEQQYIPVNFVTEPIIQIGEYVSIKITKDSNNLYIYRNNKLFDSRSFDGILHGITSVINIGFNSEHNSNYKGIIRNLYLNIEARKSGILYNTIFNLPLQYTLKDNTKIIPYTNYGTRFITVPQLIQDTTGKDIYGNALIGSI